MASRPTFRFAISTIAIAWLGAACVGSSPDAAVPEPDAAAVPIPPPPSDDAHPPEESTPPPSSGSAADHVAESTTAGSHGPVAALIDTDGQLALVERGTIVDTWMKWTAFPSPDRSTAVLTLGPHIEGIGDERPVAWVSLPDGERLGEQTMRTDSELTATSLDGSLAGFTTRAREAVDGSIAGARTSSLIQVVARDDGLVFEQRLDGNFVPEAFSRTMSGDGVPAMVFLLEYVPADAPRFYRVRVLATDTGEVSLPVDLRDKSHQVDERMAGSSRAQVVAGEHGLLFTLYRGTVDGTPDGDPYAFVHTLDFADGVWCLEVDPRLELDELPGSLAAGGDRLYVASANGRVGSFRIPSITDPGRSPAMDWVVDVTAAGDRAPALAADGDGVWIGPDDPASRLVRLDGDGERADPVGLPGDRATALAFDRSGHVHAVGADWATVDLGRRPDWLDDVMHLVVD